MEVNGTIYESVESVVLTNGNVVTRIVLSTTLANDNVTSNTLLTTEDLDAKSLSCALTTVLRTTYTFFMCHNVVPPTFLSDYRLDYYFCELLTMTVANAIVLTTLHLENDDLVTLYEWVHYFTHYFCSVYGGSAYLNCTVSIYEQYLVKFNSLACLNILDVVHEELLALLGLELLTLNFYNCVHLLFICI